MLNSFSEALAVEIGREWFELGPEARFRTS